MWLLSLSLNKYILTFCTSVCTWCLINVKLIEDFLLNAVSIDILLVFLTLAAS